MLGGMIKLTLSFSAVFLFIALVWQAATVAALPVLEANDNLVKSNDDVSRLLAINSHTGAAVVERSLYSTVDQHSLIDRSSYDSSHHRHLKKISPHNSFKSSSNLFRSTGTLNKNLRAAKRIKAALDNRLKRFRMLDQDEFQEMLKTLSQQTTDEQTKTANGMDTIGGMQLANYWSHI